MKLTAITAPVQFLKRNLQPRKYQLELKAYNQKLIFGLNLRVANSNETLTAREKEILDLLAKGQINKEVANQLEISNGTVRKHIQNIYEKLHVNTRVEAVNLYLKR